MSAVRHFARPLFLALALLAVPSGPAASAAGERAAVGSREDADLVATLIRSHLVALHQANVSGNYSVLRDIGTRAFRAQFTAADLSAVFAPLRKAGIDLQAAVILQPAITAAPTLDERDVMHLTGTFPTAPTAVSFDFAFAVEDGVWKLVGLKVEPVAPVAEFRAAEDAALSALRLP